MYTREQAKFDEALTGCVETDMNPVEELCHYQGQRSIKVPMAKTDVCS